LVGDVAAFDHLTQPFGAVPRSTCSYCRRALRKSKEWWMKETYPMHSVEEAQSRFLERFHALDAERVPILDAVNRVLANEIVAAYDIPPHANSAMDGYAVRVEDTAGAREDAPRRLRIAGELAAGYTRDAALEPETAIRIMTGAPIPPDADAVIPFEETTRDRDTILVTRSYPHHANIRAAGEDVRAGETALEKGAVLRAQEIGMLAAMGQVHVAVIRRPCVAILSTGDEVVDASEPLAPGKIRDANGYSVAAAVVKYGGIPIRLGIARDRTEELTAKIRAGLEQRADLFVTSGGVSVGDFDVVKQVLAAEGAITFWRVRMKPGKPLAFGTIRGVPLLGLPGNPVSALMSFELFGRPALLKMQGKSRLAKPTIEATLVDEIKRKDDRRHYVRVQLETRGGETFAHLTGDQGSGILLSMVRADGVAIIPEDWTHVDAGTRVRVMMLDWAEVR
jgi:molybdopterin molybdotransferase